jgi:hypothetical protein
MKVWKKIEPYIMVLLLIIGIILLMISNLDKLLFKMHPLLWCMSLGGSFIALQVFFQWVVTPVDRCWLSTYIRCRK